MNLLRTLAFSLSVSFSLTTYPAQSPQIPNAPLTIPQFVTPLPLLSVSNGSINTIFGNQSLSIRLCEFKAKVLPTTFVPAAGSTYAGYTWVWGYLNDPTGSSNCADLIDQASGGTGIVDTFTGPVILNSRGSATSVNWINDLPTGSDTNVLAWKYSTDQTLHWADPYDIMCADGGGIPAYLSGCAQNYDGPAPAVVHLHGGEVPAELDGGPNAWMTSDGMHGSAYYSTGQQSNSAVLNYPNTQEAAPLWFHDHALGITRLNVYAGLAGAYLLADSNLSLPAGLHPFGLQNGINFEATIPLVIQDRMLDTDGQLYFPADTSGGVLSSPNPEHPYWVPEFVGDTILVNGKAWPKLDVQQKRYRFLFLNGSNARTYELFLVDPITGAAGPNLWVIGTDGGYLDGPVLTKKLTIMPGERYEAIVDFAGFANANGWLLKNTAKTPFPGGLSPQGATTSRVMKFNVLPGAVANNAFNPAAPGSVIRSTSQRIVRLPGTVGGPVANASTVQKTRTLTLNEIIGAPQNVTDPVTGLLTAYPGGPLEILVNNTKWDGASPRTYNDFAAVTRGSETLYYSEQPVEGETEIWELVNLTADAHPIHLHLVQFQLIDRQSLSVGTYNAAYAGAFPGTATCLTGVFCPAFGPPLPYDGSDARSGGKLGGNVDPRAVGANGKFLYLSGKPSGPLANERGWKDTVVVYPGQVTRLSVRFAPTDLPLATTNDLSALYYPFDPTGNGEGFGYVWHCHIIDHEDNEMMRPDIIQLNPAAPAPDQRLVRKFVSY